MNCLNLDLTCKLWTMSQNPAKMSHFPREEKYPAKFDEWKKWVWYDLYT